MRKYESYGDTKDKISDVDMVDFLEDMERIREIDEEKLALKEEDELLNSINESLGRQVRGELEEESLKENIRERCRRKRRMPGWFKALLATTCTCLLVSFLLILTPIGKNLLWQSASDYAYGKMNYDDGQNVAIASAKENTAGSNINLKDTDKLQNNENTTESSDKAGITNILLLGEEAIDSNGARGRTDIMIIATLDTKSKAIKLTSLMRDTLVQIPGNKDNKLNAAYEIGGIPLLYETLALNFGISLDGYAKVGFNDFEEVIDKLGGVPITLTKEEAKYLNSSNYISKAEYRNVKEGYQILNGSQALGYCRIRYVATSDNQINDFGRTKRQRTVLNAIYEQYKSKSLPELLLIMKDILPLITTDIKKEEFNTYLQSIMSLIGSDIKSLRLPADNTYEEGHIRSMAVLIPDLTKNEKILHEFIYGN